MDQRKKGIVLTGNGSREAKIINNGIQGIISITIRPASQKCSRRQTRGRRNRNRKPGMRAEDFILLSLLSQREQEMQATSGKAIRGAPF